MTTASAATVKPHTNQQNKLLVLIEHIGFLGALLVGFTERITLILENRFGIATPWLIITSIFTLTLLVVWILTGSVLFMRSYRASETTNPELLEQQEKGSEKLYSTAYLLLTLLSWGLIAGLAAILGGWVASPPISKNEVLSLAVVLAGQIALLPSIIFNWK